MFGDTHGVKVNSGFSLYLWVGGIRALWISFYMGTPAAGGRVGGRAASTGFLLSKSKSFHQFFIKLGEYVGVHNVSTKFYNQPNPQAILNYGPLIVGLIRVSAL